jgi:serine/threonine protein phosphatase 1
MTIHKDMTANPTARSLHVFVGDYIDRGPDSRQVIDRLIALARTHDCVFLKGNHEAVLLDFLQRPSALAEWRQYGGLETLMSYGLTPSINPDEKEQEALCLALNRALPDSHREFLAELRPSFSCGDLFFVHAGVRPGVALKKQHEEDLLWIRDEFLSHEGYHEKIIVHGHTPNPKPEICPNRINIDTGAYATGRLTCAIFEEDKVRFIEHKARRI